MCVSLKHPRARLTNPPKIDALQKCLYAGQKAVCFLNSERAIESICRERIGERINLSLPIFNSGSPFTELATVASITGYVLATVVVTIGDDLMGGAGGG